MPSPSSLIARLDSLRGDFAPSAIAEKQALLQSLAADPPDHPRALQRWHSALLYLRAFPDNVAISQHAITELDQFHERVSRLAAADRRRLGDSGIAGTTVCYRYSFDVARWFLANTPGAVAIDWPELDDEGPLDELLATFVQPAEELAYTDGGFTARSWFAAARGDAPGTDFDWLIRELRRAARRGRPLDDFFESADLPVGWRLADSPWSLSRNRVPIRRPHLRRHFRKPPTDIPAWIAQPLPGVRKLAPRAGHCVLDVAIAALAARQREVYSMNRANPAEVWHAPLGEGVDLAVFGVLPAARPVLEGNYGYMLFANGAPVGYGGVSPLFAQGNTGINIFPEYRKSEAPFLWVQTLRAFHTLFGCRHFIANPYQFGGGNREAIGSGAFWFYYRLGFRPTNPQVRRLAEREAARLSRDRRHRSSPQTLRDLAQSDLVLSVHGATADEIFDEAGLVTLARCATQRIAEIHASMPGVERTRVVQRIAREVFEVVGLPPNRAALRSPASLALQLALYFAVIRDLPRWPPAQRRALADLLRARSAAIDRPYCEKLAAADRLRGALAEVCRAAAGRRNRRHS